MVEQGTENPRVGGSIPSLATISLLAAAAALTGCAADPCDALCGEVATALDGCLDAWGASWEDFGADGRRDYQTTCQNEWAAARADLQVRQVPEQEDRCDAGSAALDELDCDALKVLYLDP